jgi:NCAIR mutase (PurE)-related protein
MDEARLRELLAAVAVGMVSEEEALRRLRTLPYEDLGFARLDHHRALREGIPEVILGEGKTARQIIAIAEAMLRRSDRLLATRVEPGVALEVTGAVAGLDYHDEARCLTAGLDGCPAAQGVVIACAGTADLPVAQEAAITSRMLGFEPARLYDVGVAGIHRLLDKLPVLLEAKAIVVVAGMEGALPSVVGGLVSAPVIAVPTSVGYGAHLGGLTPLLAMLNSCAPGVAVVNIDNGFGAGYLAAQIARQSSSGLAAVP